MKTSNEIRVVVAIYSKRSVSKLPKTENFIQVQVSSLLRHYASDQGHEKFMWLIFFAVREGTNFCSLEETHPSGGVCKRWVNISIKKLM